MDKCTFHIEVDADNIENIQRALKQVGVSLNPVNDMIAIPHEPLLYGILSGAEFDEMKSATDQYFQETEFHLRLVDNLTTLPVSTRMALLNAFSFNTDWTSGERPEIRFIAPPHLQALTSRHPEAFQEA